MDQNYSVLKNQFITKPTENIDLGESTNRYGNLYLSGNINLGNVVASETTLNVPKVSAVTFPNDAIAGSPVGGETVTIVGSGFLAGASVYVANVQVPAATVVSSNAITFTSPIKADGTYSLAIINPDGASAIFVPGITYSDFPVFSTTAGSLGVSWEGNSVTSTVSASSDSNVNFSVTSGALPTGLTVSGTGAVTGTLATAPSGNTTYNFTVTASDQEQQKTSRNFSYTVQGDTLTWNSPSNNTSFTKSLNTAISDIVLDASSALAAPVTYTANTLPTGLVLSGNTISGSPTVIGNTTSLITATSTRQSSIQLNFTIPNPFVAATGGTVTTVGNYKIHTFTTSGVFNVASTSGATSPVEILIVAGGGSGGYYYDAGGGGAGAVLYAPSYTLSTTGDYAVTVGAGGPGAGSRVNGGNSSFTTSAIANGGGAGGSPDNGIPGNAGGSGGGGAGLNGNTAGKPGGASNQANVTGFTKYGNAGGTGYEVSNVPYGAGGGGGGAGAAGATTTSGSGAAGGAGIVNPITGSTTGELVTSSYYIGGGGGGGSDYAPGGSGGIGGGGKGQGQGTSASVEGSANTGGGGGGSSRYVSASNKSGGSGVVIIRYQFQ